jgi:hypothetical protein
VRSSSFLAPAFDARVQEGAQPAQRALDPVRAQPEAAGAGRAAGALAVGRRQQRAAALGQPGKAVPERVDVVLAVAVAAARVPDAIALLDLALGDPAAAALEPQLLAVVRRNANAAPGLLPSNCGRCSTTTNTSCTRSSASAGSQPSTRR